MECYFRIALEFGIPAWCCPSSAVQLLIDLRAARFSFRFAIVNLLPRLYVQRKCIFPVTFHTAQTRTRHRHLSRPCPALLVTLLCAPCSSLSLRCPQQGKQNTTALNSQRRRLSGIQIHVLRLCFVHFVRQFIRPRVIHVCTHAPQIKVLYNECSSIGI